VLGILRGRKTKEGKKKESISCLRLNSPPLLYVPSKKGGINVKGGKKEKNLALLELRPRKKGIP